MKKTVLACLMAGVLAAPSAFAVSIVKFTDRPGGPGGEFGADLGANGTVDFVTFCLEANEPINPNNSTIYYYQVSQAAISGGISGGNPDPISRATAWLYLQFLSGTLGSFGSQYNYDGSAADANDLQRAIWYLEGEISGTTYGVNNYYAQLAASQGGAGDNNGYFDVGVMNIYSRLNSDGTIDYTTRIQDQLTPLPSRLTVPDGGTTLSLLGIAMAGLAFVTRRLRTA